MCSSTFSEAVAGTADSQSILLYVLGDKQATTSPVVHAHIQMSIGGKHCECADITIVDPIKSFVLLAIVTL